MRGRNGASNLKLRREIATVQREVERRELALFGSALRDDFKSGSDVDLLVSFKADAQWSLLDHVSMQEELEDVFERKVDLVSRRGLERSQNYIRRNEILNSAKVIYDAA